MHNIEKKVSVSSMHLLSKTERSCEDAQRNQSASNEKSTAASSSFEQLIPFVKIAEDIEFSQLEQLLAAKPKWVNGYLTGTHLVLDFGLNYSTCDAAEDTDDKCVDALIALASDTLLSTLMGRVTSDRVVLMTSLITAIDGVVYSPSREKYLIDELIDNLQEGHYFKATLEGLGLGALETMHAFSCGINFLTEQLEVGMRALTA